MTRESREKPANNDTSKFPPKPVNKSNRTPNGAEKFKGGYKGKNPKVKFNKVNLVNDNTSFKSLTVSNEGQAEISTSSILASTENPSSLGTNLSIKSQ